MKEKFYLTTSIAYTNAPPHVGFALELIQADVIARYQRLSGKDVFFLTGTDEHGQKVAKAAQNAGKSPREFTDGLSGKYRELAEVLNISNNDFIRTTDQKKHWPSVKKAWLAWEKKGDIYKKNYKGIYCAGCEAFITKKDLSNGKCGIHQWAEPEIIEEENYFFRLSRYSKKIEEILKKDKVKIIPEGKKNEMLSFARQGLEDISFSRPRKDLRWGIPVPNDDSQTVYVWGDALTNYISALGYDKNSAKFKKYWPADVHFIGKDIQKFHSLIWPGMLLSLGLPLPKKIFVHGFITVAGQKMSKSLGNVINPFELVEKYGADAVRYFLLREIPPSEDGDFTTEKFEKRYNADLASGLGNLTSRVITMAEKFKIKRPKFKPTGENLKAIDACWTKYEKALADFRFNEALSAIWELIGWCDRYIEKERPWSFDPAHDKEKQNEVMGNLLLMLEEIAELLIPFLPDTSAKMLKQLRNYKTESIFPRV
ncbi:MAG: methionine--tRNA ligase [Candidatus Nealsonbacteria bacterium]|nr:methionine--tRNA ligase [Candidatus Nealsonbacteria bacterium]